MIGAQTALDNRQLLFQEENIKLFFRLYSIEMLVISSAFLLSIICIALSATLRVHYRRQISLEFLGWGILAAAVWNAAVSPYSQLFSQNAAAVSSFARCIFMLLPLPFLIYMDLVQKKRYHRAYRLTEIIVLADFAVCSVLNVSGLSHFSATFPCTVAVTILFAFLIILTELMDLRAGHMKEYPALAVGSVIILVASFTRAASAFADIVSFKHMLLPLGLIPLLFLAVANTAHEILEIEHSRQEAQLASAAKGKFLANMSHEIRTPINAVLGMNAMILRESTEAPIREYAMDIQNAGQNLLSLINDILDLSKAESGKLEILPEEYDFGNLIHDVMNMVSTKAADKGLSIQLSIDEAIPAILWGDDVRIRQILVNLMNNAVKYTEQGSVTLTVSGSTEDGTASLDFQVKDTGIGIKQEDIAKLFAEFERIEEDRNRNIEGTGLGMSITTQLLELMESKLQVESIYGKGSVFSFTLRQRIIDDSPVGNLEKRIARQAAEYSYQAAFTAPEALILVVDDNALNRRVFRNLLKETKVTVEEAGGGFECLELTGQKHYDMIFLDHMMPDLDGIETLHRMKAAAESPCHETPIVALTANALAGAKEQYISEGFSSFLSKPILPDKLEQMLMENLPPEKVLPGSPRQASATDTDTSAFAALPDIDGIDWDYALRYTNDKHMLLAAAKDFYQTMGSEAAQLAQMETKLETLIRQQHTDSFSQDNYTEALRQYEVKVHSMKSTANMVGAVSLSGIAKLLEYAARDGRADFLERVTPAFLEEWMALQERLQPLAEEDNAEKTAAEPTKVRELLEKLSVAMADMDISASDDIAAQLSRFRYSEQTAPLMEKLLFAVTSLDTEQAEQMIEQIKKLLSQES